MVPAQGRRHGCLVWVALQFARQWHGKHAQHRLGKSGALFLNHLRKSKTGDANRARIQTHDFEAQDQSEGLPDK
jgi:hypothetical protein